MKFKKFDVITVLLIVASSSSVLLQRAQAQQVQSPAAPAPVVSTPNGSDDLTNNYNDELNVVTQLKNGIKPAASTGTRGGGNLSLVDMKSLEDFISSGKLNQAVKAAALKIDPAKSFFSDTAADWQTMLNRGMIADIEQTPYTFSENGTCPGSIDQGTGASTEAALKAPVCWDLQHLIAIHDSMDTLVILGIRAEARHFSFDYNSTRVISEMAATQLRAQ